MTTGVSEKGLEGLIVESLVEEAGYQQGQNEDYDRDHAIDGCLVICAARFSAVR